MAGRKRLFSIFFGIGVLTSFAQASETTSPNSQSINLRFSEQEDLVREYTARLEPLSERTKAKHLQNQLNQIKVQIEKLKMTANQLDELLSLSDDESSTEENIERFRVSSAQYDEQLAILENLLDDFAYEISDVEESTDALLEDGPEISPMELKSLTDQ